MFSEITPEHSLLQYSTLLEFAPGRSGEDEAPEEGDELAVLPQHWLGGFRG